MSDKTAIAWTDQAPYTVGVAEDDKWCTKCKDRHPRSEFGKDLSRGDGLAASCRRSRSTGHPVGWHDRPNINPLTGKPGPAPKPLEEIILRAGDRAQVRQLVNHQIKIGRLPHPNTLPCEDCGHVWFDGERRHEYDHHSGYDKQDYLAVEAVCTTCHAARHRSWEGKIRDAKGRWC